MAHWHKGSFPGVRYRKHPERKHGVQQDKYFVLTYKLDGKTKSEAVGWASEGWTEQKSYDLLRTIKQNQKLGMKPRTLKELREAIALEEKKKMETGSVEALFEAYSSHLRREGKSSWREVRRALVVKGKYPSAADVLGRSKKASDVNVKDIQKALVAVHARAPSMAAHLRAYLHGAFSWGISREYDYARARQDVYFSITHNPVASIPRNSSAFRASDRVLNNEEIKDVWCCLDNYCTELLSDLIRLILAVGGQRVKEVAHSEVKEFDLGNSIWTIPCKRTKNNREHVVALSVRAVDILKKYIGNKVYVFESKNGKPVETTSINKAISRYCVKNKVERWTPKDLRRTCRTILSEHGVPPHVLNWHFNHGYQGVGEKHYDRASHYNEKKVLMQKWEDILTKILSDKPSNMVLIRGVVNE